MKRISFISLLLIAICLNICAKRYNITWTHKTAFMMKSILVYDKDANGSMFPVNETRYYERISGSIKFYAYEKKNKELYACTTYANYVFTLTKLGEKEIKKFKEIPRLSGKELTDAIENTNKEK